MTFKSVSDRTSQIRVELEQQLRISAEQITAADLETINTLILSREAISSLNLGDFQGLINLETLELDSNGFTGLDADIFAGLGSLTRLGLHHNSLTSLHVEIFDGLTSLQSLSLGGNRLTSFQDGTFSVDRGLMNLTYLGLDSAGLTSLQADVFSGLTNLKELNLPRNALTGESLSAGAFSGLTELEVLYLYSNRLTSLDEDIFAGLGSLQRLELDRNSLTGLDEDIFDGLGSLQRLGLHHNNLTSLHAEIFDGLESLESLSLGGNRLGSFQDGTFSADRELKSLTYLGLDSAGLTSLQADIFSGLTNLTTLNLPRNALTILTEGVFNGLTNLQELYLQENSLTTLSGEIFGNLSSLRHLRLDGNTDLILSVGILDDVLDTLETLSLPGERSKRTISISGNDAVVEGNQYTATISISETLPFDIHVPYQITLTGGTADDFAAGTLLSGTQIIYAGDFSAEISVTLLADDSIESGESFMLSLEDGFEIARATDGQVVSDLNLRLSNVVVLDQAGYEVVVTQTDAPEVTVSFDAASYAADEGDTAGTEIKVDLRLGDGYPDGGTLGREVRIPITFSEEGGAAVRDYQISGGTWDRYDEVLVFDATDTFVGGLITRTLTIIATDDSDDDDGEHVKLDIEIASLPGGVTPGTQGTTQVNLNDNDEDDPTTIAGGEGVDVILLGNSITTEIDGNAGADIYVITAKQTGRATIADYDRSRVVFEQGVTIDSLEVSGGSLLLWLNGATGENRVKIENVERHTYVIAREEYAWRDFITDRLGRIDKPPEIDVSDIDPSSVAETSLNGGSGDDVFSFGFNMDISSNGGGGNDKYYITDLQIGDLTITDSEVTGIEGKNSVFFQKGVAVSGFEYDQGMFEFTLGSSAGLTIHSPSNNDYRIGEGGAALTANQFILWMMTQEGEFNVSGAMREFSGSDGTERLYGSIVHDYLAGLKGDDELDGREGNDLLFGGEGSDALIGGAGADILDGGEGDDDLSGGDMPGDGEGDIFVYRFNSSIGQRPELWTNSNYGVDEILDFSVSDGDRLYLVDENDEDVGNDRTDKIDTSEEFGAVFFLDGEGFDSLEYDIDSSQIIIEFGGRGDHRLIINLQDDSSLYSEETGEALYDDQTGEFNDYNAFLTVIGGEDALIFG